jgi:hypothetical protein
MLFLIRNYKPVAGFCVQYAQQVTLAGRGKAKRRMHAPSLLIGGVLSLAFKRNGVRKIIKDLIFLQGPQTDP